MTLLSFTDGTWAVVDPAGRFDTPDLGALRGAIWTRAQDPLRPLLLTTFAREYYVPGLLRRVLAREALPPVPDLSTIDVRAPEVSVRLEEPASPSSSLTAVVDVCPPAPRPRDPSTPWEGARDLRVSLDGRLVAWVDGALGTSCSTHRFPVTPGSASKEVSAYAFNAALVKSEDARAALPERTAVVPRRRAFVVNVGVDAYADRGLRSLQWAGADARAMRDALATIPGQEVHRVLLAEGGDAPPTREHLRAVLAALSGEAPAPTWAPGLAPAGPDDLVLVTFSGHGYAPPRTLADGRTVPGAFHLMLSDLGRTDDDGIAGALAYAVSEDELAAWLRPVRAGDMALVVDACQSASSVEGEDFRPGPLGSRGFGQLAYDKGMLVLAASQSDAVALEDNQLRHGLLTWALVREGLEQGRADADGSGTTTLAEWLGYAETRVPSLAQAVARGEAIPGARAVDVRGTRDLILPTDDDDEAATPQSVAQQPRLFAFKGAGGVVVAGEGAPGP